MRSYKRFYRTALEHLGETLHFAAHSHHLWPDITRSAHEAYWQDSVRLLDKKWDYIMGTVIADVSQGIAGHLGLSHPQSIAFAPNTHELVSRLISALPWEKLKRGQRLKIVTTDSEFYSVERQLSRLNEEGVLELNKVSVEPIDTFTERLKEALHPAPDMLFLSHVFFNSGVIFNDLELVVKPLAHDQTLIVLDGYHGFMAVPTSLKPVEHHVFYLSGGYKYAQAGEGVCFMAIPEGDKRRPVFTGWFAELNHLSDTKTGTVSYANNGLRYWGATFDPSGLYRLRSVLRWMKEEEIEVGDIHHHVNHLQQYFLNRLREKNHPFLQASLAYIYARTKGVQDDLFPPEQWGHFITFETEKADHVESWLQHEKVYCDRRGHRLRLGFGLYHDEEDVEKLLSVFKRFPF